MRIITDKKAKEELRTVQRIFFNQYVESFDNVLNKVLLNRKDFYFEIVGSNELFRFLSKTFSDTYPEFYIATRIDSDPIIMLDLREDTPKDYYGILLEPKSVGLDFPDPEVGLYIVYEEIFFFNMDKHWYLYANRYEDKAVVMWE